MSWNAMVNAGIKLGADRFHASKDHPHIVLTANLDINEFRKSMEACLTGFYKQGDAGNTHFDFVGCLECGTYWVLCGNTIPEQW